MCGKLCAKPCVLDFSTKRQGEITIAYREGENDHTAVFVLVGWNEKEPALWKATERHYLGDIEILETGRLIEENIAVDDKGRSWLCRSFESIKLSRLHAIELTIAEYCANLNYEQARVLVGIEMGRMPLIQFVRKQLDNAYIPQQTIFNRLNGLVKHGFVNKENKSLTELGWQTLMRHKLNITAAKPKTMTHSLQQQSMLCDFPDECSINNHKTNCCLH